MSGARKPDGNEKVGVEQIKDVIAREGTQHSCWEWCMLQPSVVDGARSMFKQPKNILLLLPLTTNSYN